MYVALVKYNKTVAAVFPMWMKIFVNENVNKNNFSVT